MLLCRLSYRPTVDPPGLEPGTRRLTIEVALFFTSPYPCGRWGSNPRHLGGSQGCFRYTTSTKRVRTKRRRRRPNGRRGKSKYPAPTHHPRRNPQESNLLPPGLQPGAHPHELEFHCVQTGGVEPPPRGPEPRMLPLHHVRLRDGALKQRGRRVLSHGTTVQLSKSSSRAPVSGHAAARWEALEPSSPGLEPGVLALDDHRSRVRIACATRRDYQKSRIDFWVRPRGRIRYAHVNVDSCSLPSSCFLTLRITSDGEAESRSGQHLFRETQTSRAENR